MLCAKCQKNEATVHLTTVVGTEQETVDLCRDCAPPGIAGLDLGKAKALSTTGKKCEFCGAAAYSGQVLSGGGTTYWCFKCGTELMSIVAELVKTERPDLLRRSKKDSSFVAFCSDPEVLAWSEVANQKAVRILKERRKQDGRSGSS